MSKIPRELLELFSQEVAEDILRVAVSNNILKIEIQDGQEVIKIHEDFKKLPESVRNTIIDRLFP